jgi:hypothetical protein
MADPQVFDPAIGFLGSVPAWHPTGGRMPRLTVELIPRTTWGVNVRSQEPALWGRIRKEALRRNGRRCASCRNPPKRLFHVHEQFAYDDQRHVQQLVGFEVLCETCHAVKHAGRTINTTPGGLQLVLRALADANGWDQATCEAHLYLAFEVWEVRSQHGWYVDLRYAHDYLPPAS